MTSMFTDKPQATLLPLGDSALLVRFGTTLTSAANLAALAFAHRLEQDPITGVLESASNLISVVLRYDATTISFNDLGGEVRLRLSRFEPDVPPSAEQTIGIRFHGPDLPLVSETLGLTTEAFIAAHNKSSLRVLSTGFAPGFVYCGLHAPELVLPRRREVRSAVPPGSVLFAAGQTAITATAMPTGWHVIGETDFANFDPLATPPTKLKAGDLIRFEAIR